MKKNNKFIIFKPSKSAMQSGLYKPDKWCLLSSDINEFFKSAKFGWNGSTNPEKKIKLYFETLDEATRFAIKNNYNFQVIEPLKRKILKKSYAQNFIKKN